MLRLAYVAVVTASLSGCGDDQPRTINDALSGPGPTLARGAYLVEHVANCGDCHSPRGANGEPDPKRALAGRDCLLDIVPADSFTGCLAAPNITNDPSGIGKQSDDQVKRMFLDGIDEQGMALIPVMPYQVFHNFSERDADAIVMYLRSVQPMFHETQSQPPWVRPPAPAPYVPQDTIPMPSVSNSQTRNGRYLASIACMECHTPRTNPLDPGSYDLARLFAGGNDFPAASLGLPVPPFPPHIYAWNLTPDPTGIGRFSRAQVIDVVKQGHDPEGGNVCPPMPAGPLGGFGGLTDGDVDDIVSFLEAIPPVANMIPNDCVAPAQRNEEASKAP